MNNRYSRTLLATALTLWLTGCMVGPDYQRPQAAVPAHYKELAGWTQAAPAAAAPKGDWWTGFHDPLLDRLEPMVVVSNQTVREDYANYQQALAAVKEARSALFPTIGLSGAATRQRSAGGRQAAATGRTGSVSSAGSLEGDVSWAPDLWGKVRRTVQENKASAQASAATLANATLSMQTALASAVIELRVSDANTDLLHRTVAAYQEYLRVVSNQGNVGITPPSDVLSARTQLDNAQASLIALGVARARYAHAIAVLVGKNPEALDIRPDTALPTLPQTPAGIPSTLLQRRPDIAIAERQMAAANAAIGVATAAYYPTLSLSGSDGFSQSPLVNLLQVANHVWSLGGDLGATLFEGGQRHAQVAAAKAGYEAAVANYRGSVLTALQNVEDDLSSLRILAQQAQALDATVHDATRAATIAMNEYQAGTVDFTTAATARAAQYSAQQSALGVRQQRLLAAVSLIGDLGGGWSDSALDGPAQTAAPR